MKLLAGKMVLYAILILFFLEIIVRVFHLYFEYPPYYINQANVKTYLPNQKGHFVTGNRRMNYAEFNINNSGFNSYREYVPTEKSVDIALIGDSFIEGFHQNYDDSLGKKVEDDLNGSVNVFEYGHAGYDLADQFHLIQAYKEQFDLIDHIFIYIKFENDLKRSKYTPNHWRVNLQYSTTFLIRDKIKLTTYAERIGIFNPFVSLKNKLLGILDTNDEDQVPSEEDIEKYMDNFKALINTFGINKNKTTFLLDKRKTSSTFIDYCDKMGYNYLDFGNSFEKSEDPTTLIYDMHWNDHGRSVIAKEIANYLTKNILEIK